MAAHDPIARSPSGPIRRGSNYVFSGAVDEADEQALGRICLKPHAPYSLLAYGSPEQIVHKSSLESKCSFLLHRLSSQ
ncbi:uncharacterized protein TrAtP1_009606 [Trichoderma atroviride]|uniref:uncharacterized protein n=1 Tax=Hypocrea atroviridis TaxID=63577 RepID=UPI003324CE77|nr:hypothetical protein TrAtP1_009606 [Trichoderma atroviride]